MHQFSILTPTYNRAKYLKNVYYSLCQQNNIDIEWIIVDDGSTDNTKEIINSFNENDKLKIKYIYKDNSGKPSAMNEGFKQLNSYITLITMDSEDSLCSGSLEAAWSYFDIHKKRFENDCVCLSGLCQYENKKIIGMKFPNDYYVSDYIKYIKNTNTIGDKCEFYITDILRCYPFPIFKDEKNIAPSIIPIRIALSYKTLFVNKIFQEKQFLQDGLSTQNYWLKYPLSSEYYYNEASTAPFILKLQIKHSAKYIFFAKINKKKHIFKEAKNKSIFILGLMAFYFIALKYFLKRTSFTTEVLNSKEYKIFTQSNDS